MSLLSILPLVFAALSVAGTSVASTGVASTGVAGADGRAFAPGGFAHPVCRPAAPAPIRIEMTPTRRALGASAVYEMRFARSSFGVTVSDAGYYMYDVDVAVKGLRSVTGREYVVWVATPNLTEWLNLGLISEDRPASGRVDWNKFIVFVTAEASADVEAWSQEFYFSALSPSARMHTMVGHGPFSSEPCLDFRN